jgi:KaiC/GvpD/RAD55 family RecA-like ATPase
VRTFLSSDAGRSLLVEGEAGTGKTTFALQLLEELGAPDRSFYLSTRVSDDSLYSMFPWLREKDMQSRVIDAGKLLLESLVRKEKEEEPKKAAKEDVERITRARQFLHQIGEHKEAPTKVDRSRLNVMLEHFKMPEVERVYDRIENCLPERSMLVIDSVEGVTHKYGLDMEEFVTTLQKDLVEGSGCNVIFVLEKVEASHIEYVVDGVISLERGELDRRRVRHSHLHKLRATEIKQPHYMLTLRGGRFSSFAPYTPNYTGAKKWEPRSDPEGFYSTGIPDFDTLLGGGFRRGSYHVFEVSEDVTNEDYFAIIRPILLNFIAQGRALFSLLSGGDHPETLRNDLIRFIDPETFDSKVRIPDYFLQESKEKYVMALGGKTAQENLKLWMEAMQVLRGPKNRPIIEFTGFDTLEYIRGGDVAVKMLLNAVAKMKISEDLGIGILKPGLKVTQEIINMADTYFKVVSIDKCPCIYGVKPKTIIHAIVGDEEKGAPHVKLMPIV